MSDGIKDRIKSSALGVVLPLALMWLAMPYVTGARLRTRRGSVLTPVEAFGCGLTFIGVALCIHAFFYWRYDHHPIIKWTMVAVGVVSVVGGLSLFFS